MSLSRYGAISLVGFALLASACPDDMDIQRPKTATVGHAGTDEEQTPVDPHDKGEGEIDAGNSEVDAGSPEADAGSVEVDAGGGDDAGEDMGPGLPCEIHALLKSHCQGCHSASAKNGVPLMTRADLTAPSKVDANSPVWKRVIERMASSERPMPPMGKGNPVTEDELATFEAWAESGALAERCDP